MNVMDNRLGVLARLAARRVQVARLRPAEAPTMALPFGCPRCGAPDVSHNDCTPFVPPFARRHIPAATLSPRATTGLLTVEQQTR